MKNITSTMKCFGLSAALFMSFTLGMQDAYAGRGSCHHASSRFDAKLEALYDAHVADGLPESDYTTSNTDDIEDNIYAKYGTETALFVMDLSNFTRLSFDYNFPTVLAHHDAVLDKFVDIIEDNGGELVEEIADTQYALFPTVTDALRTFYEMRTTLETMLTNGETIIPNLSVGIGYADDVIRVGRRNCVTNAVAQEVNFTFGAGEESAEDGEILLTLAGYNQFKSESTSGWPSEFSIDHFDKMERDCGNYHEYRIETEDHEYTAREDSVYDPGDEDGDGSEADFHFFEDEDVECDKEEEEEEEEEE